MEAVRAGFSESGNQFAGTMTVLSHISLLLYYYSKCLVLHVPASTESYFFTRIPQCLFFRTPPKSSRPSQSWCLTDRTWSTLLSADRFRTCAAMRSSLGLVELSSSLGSAGLTDRITRPPPHQAEPGESTKGGRRPSQRSGHFPILYIGLWGQ